MAGRHAGHGACCFGHQRLGNYGIPNHRHGTPGRNPQIQRAREVPGASAQGSHARHARPSGSHARAHAGGIQIIADTPWTQRVQVSFRRRFFSALPYAALLAWACLLHGCSTLGEIEAPTLYLANITLADATLFEQQYRLQFRVQNPNPVALPIDGIAYELEINGMPFAKGASDQSLTIPRFGSALLEVEGASNLWDILRQAKDLKPEKTGQLQYRLKGKLSIANGKTTRFDYQGAF
jgi:LEA14-like dessication related protein